MTKVWLGYECYYDYCENEASCAGYSEGMIDGYNEGLLDGRSQGD